MTDYITIVSGLPRSGIALMMRLLAAGGLPRVDDMDSLRARTGFLSGHWLEDAQGRVLSLPLHRIYDLSEAGRFRLILMDRPVLQIVEAQERALHQSGQDPERQMRDVFANTYQSDLTTFRRWVVEQPHIAWKTVDFDRLRADPNAVLNDVARFLDASALDQQAMAALVDAHP